MLSQRLCAEDSSDQFRKVFLLELQLISGQAVKLPPAKMVCGCFPFTLCFTSLPADGHERDTVLFHISEGFLVPALEQSQIFGSVLLLAAAWFQYDNLKNPLVFQLKNTHTSSL